LTDKPVNSSIVEKFSAIFCHHSPTWQCLCYRFPYISTWWAILGEGLRVGTYVSAVFACGQGGNLPKGRSGMTEKLVRLAPREQQIVELLLQGCDNSDIAKQLKMARRTVKAHFNRLFLRFGIHGGIKRVKLATLLYRRQLCSEANATENVPPVNESSLSSNLSPRDSKTKKSPTPLEPQNTSSKTTYEASTTNSDFGTALNLPYGTKPADMKAQRTPDEPVEWNDGPPLNQKEQPRVLQRAAASWD